VWFVAWLIFSFATVLVPLSYGWGHRGWGPPQPWLWRRRDGAPSPWGAAADVVLGLAVFSTGWLVVGLVT
jgi:hypothetical protein